MRGLLSLVLVLAFVLVVPSADATPRYALRVGQSCVLCHQNVTGGGARSPYAAQYLVPTRLAFPRGEVEEPATNPQISDDLVLGADLRTFWRDREDADARNNFVQMQGSLYVTLQLDERFSAYVHEELGQGTASAYEIFGMGWLVPGTAWVKVGRFVPAFGWRPADHRSFTRRSFVYFPENPPQSDTGIELGARRGPCDVQVALTNGEFGSAFELNDELAFAARTSLQRSWGPANFAAGASYGQNRGLDRHRWTGGPFFGASWDRITWWGEFDWTHVEPGRSAGPTPLGVQTGFTTSQELAVQLRQGLDLVGTYDFHDPDTRLASGAGSRIGAGLEALVRPFLQLRGKLDWFSVDAGPAAPPLPGDTRETQLEVHFLY